MTLPRYYINFGIAFTILTLTVLLLTGTQFAHADEAGRVELNGRNIILFDDNTWRYAADSDTSQTSGKNDGCVLIKSKKLPVAVCLNEDNWKLKNESGQAEFLFHTIDNNLYLMVITEETEIPLKAYESAILNNAQLVAGLKPVDVTTNERFESFGREWGKMIYNVDIKGLVLKYENYFTTIKGEGSVQFVFFATQKIYPTKTAEIEKVLKTIKIE